jgi:hypothetical protein
MAYCSAKKAELEDYQREVRVLWKRTMKMSSKYVEFLVMASDKNEEAA